MEHVSGFKETQTPTTEQYLEYDILFKCFSLKDIGELSNYQEEIFSSDGGVAKLALDPISKEFIDKFPDTYKILEENNDQYDEVFAPTGECLEELIAKDEAIQALINAYRIAVKIEGSKAMILFDNGPRLEAKEAYKNALWVRRSVLAYKFKQDNRSLLTISEVFESEINNNGSDCDTIVLDNNRTQEKEHSGPENLGRSA